MSDRAMLLGAALAFMGLLGGGPRIACQEGPTPLYFGNEHCVGCHGKTLDVRTKSLPRNDADLYALLAEDKTHLYRAIEQSIWEQCDKHKDATLVLRKETNARAKLMAENLDPKRFNTKDLTKEAACLICHGVWIDPKTPAKQIEMRTFSEEKREKSGVSCVACHGPYKDWVNEHAQIISSWQDFDRPKKKSLGMADLWNPLERAELCASCHVGKAGDRARGIPDKFVTHEMYAAGHPPLPGFEIVAFADSMPRHWETLKEKSARLSKDKDKYKQWHGHDASADHNEQIEMLFVGAVVAARENVKLARDMAKRPDWAEFAVFDCYACHHDLKAKSWRIERGYKGPPGRPMLRPWADPLFDLAVQSLGDAALVKEGKTLSQQLVQALGEQPFGKAGEVESRADAVASWMTKVLTSADAKQAALRKEGKSLYSKKMAEEALKAVFEQAENASHDFDGSRQLAWAARVLLMEQTQGKPRARPIADKVGDNCPPLYAKYDYWTKERSDAMHELEDLMLLNLPRGQRQIVDSILPAFQISTTEHHPADFKKKMRRLRELWKDGVP